MCVNYICTKCGNCKWRQNAIVKLGAKKCLILTFGEWKIQFKGDFKRVFKNIKVFIKKKKKRKKFPKRILAYIVNILLYR